jgi:hypothetical protein
LADSPSGTLGPINWGSNAVNGQLVPQAPTSAWFPMTMGATYVNPKWSTQQPYGVPPVIPSPAMAPSMPPGSQPVAPTQAGNMSSGKAMWHPTQGTIVFGLFALIAGVFMLHYVHYGSGKK